MKTNGLVLRAEDIPRHTIVTPPPPQPGGEYHVITVDEMPPHSFGFEPSFSGAERPTDLPACLPWSCREDAGPVDPYVYDGSMTPEDFEQQQAWSQLMDAVQSVGVTMEEAAEAFGHLVQCYVDRLPSVVDAVNNIVHSMVMLAEDAGARDSIPPKWWHLANFAKKARTRKKYQNRLQRAIEAALLLAGGGAE